MTITFFAISGISREAVIFLSVLKAAQARSGFELVCERYSLKQTTFSLFLFNLFVKKLNKISKTARPGVECLIANA
ncbi:MAG: hypothetical protein J0L99_06180 [Chitinophagales bacterium]|nr:hypothetical protein [Chitinophagales bacterium]